MTLPFDVESFSSFIPPIVRSPELKYIQPVEPACINSIIVVDGNDPDIVTDPSSIWKSPVKVFAPAKVSDAEPSFLISPVVAIGSLTVIVLEPLAIRLKSPVPVKAFPDDTSKIKFADLATTDVLPSTVTKLEIVGEPPVAIMAAVGERDPVPVPEIVMGLVTFAFTLNSPPELISIVPVELLSSAFEV